MGNDEQILSDALKQLGLQSNVALVHKNGFRWTLGFDQDADFPDFGKSMIKLERLLQEMTTRPIDLRLEADQDKNKREKRNVLWKDKQP